MIPRKRQRVQWRGGDERAVDDGLYVQTGQVAAIQGERVQAAQCGRKLGEESIRSRAISLLPKEVAAREQQRARTVSAFQGLDEQPDGRIAVQCCVSAHRPRVQRVVCQVENGT